MSQPFTPNATIDSRSALELHTSTDSCMFYTPECSSHNSKDFILPSSSLVNMDVELSEAESNTKQERQYNDSVLPMSTPELICDLKPPNSRSKVGPSPTQTDKVNLVPIPNIPISPMIPAKYRRVMLRNTQGSDSLPPSNSNDTVLCQSTELDRNELTLPSKKSTINRKLKPSSFVKKKKLTPLPPKLFTCQDCANTYTRLSAYERHILRHTSNSELIRCDVCDLTFNSKRAFNFHKYQHADNNNSNNTTTRKSARRSVMPGVTSSIVNISIADNTFRISEDNHSSKRLKKNSSNYTLQNSPVTSTPNIAKLEETVRKQLAFRNSLASPGLPEIGFSDRPQISLPNKTKLFRKVYPCEECVKSYSSKRALNMHQCTHWRASKPKRARRSVFDRNSPSKL